MACDAVFLPVADGMRHNIAFMNAALKTAKKTVAPSGNAAVPQPAGQASAASAAKPYNMFF